MQRVCVVGCAGAGKSRLSRAMAGIVGLPLIHLDYHFWRPGWVEPSDEEWDEQLAELLRREAWIMDGNYSRTFETRLLRSDAVVFLDYPRRTCLRRVLKRVFSREERPDMAPGCDERIDFGFLRWIWTYNKRSRGKMVDLIERHRDGRRVEILRNDREVAAFLGRLRAESPSRR